MNRDSGVHQYLVLVKRWWWLLLVSTLIPMAVSYRFASKQPDLYQAKAILMVGTSLQNPDPDPRQMSLSNTMANAYAELARQRPVAEAVIERLRLRRTPEELVGQIGTRIYSGARLLEIQVTDASPEAAALIANALVDELIRRSPASGGNDPKQQEFIRSQLEQLQVKIEAVSEEIDGLSASLDEMTSAAEIQEAEDRITAFEQVESRYQATYADLLDSYLAESPNVLSLFAPATEPPESVPRKTRLIVAVAGAAGLALTLGAVFMMEYLDTSVRWEGDGVESILDLPVLAAIPRASNEGPLPSSNPLSPVAEAVRTLRTNLFLRRPDRHFKTLVLTSPGTTEGKSFVLANLAVVLAAGGNRVIAVDADMRRPVLHEAFDRPNVSGLADVLTVQETVHRPTLHEVFDRSNVSGPADVLTVQETDGASWASVPLQDTEFDNLRLLSGGRPPTDPLTLLTSARFSSLLEFLRGQADMILVDSPPVLGPPDARVLAALAEGTMLVVAAGLTKRESVRQARDLLLAQQGVNLLGVAVNRVKPKGSYYYYTSERREGGKPWWRRWRRRKRDDALLTLGEAASGLGISKGMARCWCKSGRLPAVRKWLLWWRVDPDELNRIIEEKWEV